MVANVKTAAVVGLETYEISVEVDLNLGVPHFMVVGLPDLAVNEAKERVRSAIKNSGLFFPAKKIIVNLAPADIKKIGSCYDLPIAIGILAADDTIDAEKTADYAFIGELSLDGSLKAVSSVLPTVIGIQKLGIKNIIVPEDNKYEAALVPDINVYAAKNLNDVVNHFATDETYVSLEKVSVDINKMLAEVKEDEYLFDFKDVKGQTKAKKALEIAAAGGHNLLMVGPPGSGKTLLSKCFASILPPLEVEEALEITKIYSIAGLLTKDMPLINKRPFRVVHHSASGVGIIGGGQNPKPGEITLAHRGVLFLDEIVEFPRPVLEVLRQPLEDGKIAISRAKVAVEYPSDFILLASMNPCPCGHLGDSQKACVCNEFQIERYRARLSGPLLDRIDMQIEVPRLSSDELLNTAPSGESSDEIRQRVVKARKIQAERYKNYGIFTNSELTPNLVKKFCQVDEDSKTMLKTAIAKFGLSGRAYDRILKLSRTIADLDGSEQIQSRHIAQCLQYRTLISNK